MKAAETRASSAIADWTPLTVVSRSLTTAEIDTFISEVSTTSTNIAAASNSPRRELRPGSADVGALASPVMLRGAATGTGSRPRAGRRPGAPGRRPGPSGSWLLTATGRSPRSKEGHAGRRMSYSWSQTPADVASLPDAADPRSERAVPHHPAPTTRTALFGSRRAATDPN